MKTLTLCRATVVTVLALAACGQPQSQAAQATGQAQRTPVTITPVATGLVNPWAVAFLSDGRFLVTERPGRLRVVARDGTLSPPLSGVPQVAAQGQGGLLDVVLDPDFATNRFVWLSYAEPGQGGSSTAVARGRLNAAATGLENTTVLFRQQPKMGGGHFGSRIVFRRDGTVFITTGERMKFDPAQDLSNHLGKVIRINRDGSVPRDNPFVGRAGARPEIWSYGHRNMQGAALHPQTGALWETEHGPRGGDEINIAEAGKNYGWPLVSFGNHYDGRDIPDHATRPEFAAPIYHWTPVIASSGMAFYTADAFPGWRGSLLVGGLVAQAVVRLTLDGNRVTGEERIPVGARVRDVRQGPDGLVYVVTDETNGRLLRISPAAR